jgi:pseudouridylate synthase
VPGPMAMDVHTVRAAVDEAEARARDAGVRGAARTPFLLTSLAEITGGRSLATNLALLEDNARVAGLVASAGAG